MARFKRLEIPDAQYYETIIDRARAGNEYAAEQVAAELSALRRVANQRARRLESAYGATQSTAQYRRFMKSNAGDPEAQLREVTKFLRSKTSTVGGYREVTTAIIESAQERGALPDDATEEQKRTFVEFWGTDAAKILKSTLGSNNVEKELSDKIAQGARINELKDLYSQFEQGQINAIELWENWEPAE